MLRKRNAAKTGAAALPRIVLVDANVFFSPRMRDLFMHLHQAKVIHVHWTKAIEEEWARNVVVKQNADPAAIQACVMGMRDAAEGWEVAGYERYVAQFDSVDEKDRHVAAAAFKLSLAIWPGRKVALVTKNFKDFPTQAFDGTEVTRYSMSHYLDMLLAETPDAVLAVAEDCRRKLRSPKYTKELYVAALMKNGCTTLAETLAVSWNVECPVAAKDGTLTYASETTADTLRKGSGRTKGNKALPPAQ